MNVTSAASNGHETLRALPSGRANAETHGKTSIDSSQQSGFLDLVNLLLVPEQDPEALTEEAAPQQDLSSPHAPPTRSSQEIAAALIRAMSNRSNSLSSNVFSDAPLNQRKPRGLEPDLLTQQLVSISAGIPIQTPTASEGTIIPQSQPALTMPTIVGLRTVSPLAFALKLTPHQQIEAESGPAIPPANDEKQTSPPQLPESILQTSQPENAPPSLTQDLDQDAVPLKSKSMLEQSIQASPGVLIAGLEHTTLAAAQEHSATDAMPKTAADALRVSAPPFPAPNPQGMTKAQDIGIRVAHAQSTVDIHLTERAGQVHVAVRTPDPSLQTSLRQDLGNLINSLDRAGFHAEAATAYHSGPGQATSSQMGGNGDSGDSETASGRHGGSHSRSHQQHHQNEGNRDQSQDSQDWIEAVQKA